MTSFLVDLDSAASNPVDNSAEVECFELLAMEAVDAVEDGRGHDAQVRSGPYNPYANGYMGSSNGGIRVAALWRRNRVTPINSRDPSGILNFASTTAQEQR
uniref:Uncharacterized protein n=2 Tax=Physcomitrium patens TaxID=3218 RepID=A0A7I4C2U4_PHYPA